MLIRLVVYMGRQGEPQDSRYPLYNRVERFISCKVPVKYQTRSIVELTHLLACDQA